MELIEFFELDGIVNIKVDVIMEVYGLILWDEVVIRDINMIVIDCIMKLGFGKKF